MQLKLSCCIVPELPLSDSQSDEALWNRTRTCTGMDVDVDEGESTISPQDASCVCFKSIAAHPSRAKVQQRPLAAGQRIKHNQIAIELSSMQLIGRDTHGDGPP